ncbi:MAG: hypothetical protein BGN94_15295 [Rhizobiales bacterium 68-8]|nr:MAG: hypothetical protein BGN94_15295 [Rhizobiales bacterium 68-8]
MMMAPPPPAIICGATICASQWFEMMLFCSVLLNCSSLMVAMLPKCGLEAALQTKMSIEPSRSCVSATRRCRSPLEEIDAAIAIAASRPTAALISAAASSQETALRDEITTEAPCSARRCAIALPMPRDEPVTIATFPEMSNSVTSRLPVCSQANQ